MDSTLVVSLIIALIGAISGILGGFLAGKQQGRQQLELEHRKWLLVREDDLAKETRLAVADLTRKIASGIHEIVWLAWKAKHFPRQLTQKDILKYDKESHGMIPEIVGSLTIVSALNSEIYDELVPLAHEYFDLEGEMASAAYAFQDSPKNAIDGMAEVYEKAEEANRKLEEKVKGVFYGSTI